MKMKCRKQFLMVNKHDISLKNLTLTYEIDEWITQGYCQG